MRKCRPVARTTDMIACCRIDMYAILGEDYLGTHGCAVLIRVLQRAPPRTYHF